MNLFTAAEAAANYSTAGAGKTKLPIPKMMLLAILASIAINVGRAFRRRREKAIYESMSPGKRL